jgi:hypothetical protein
VNDQLAVGITPKCDVVIMSLISVFISMLIKVTPFSEISYHTEVEQMTPVLFHLISLQSLSLKKTGYLVHILLVRGWTEELGWLRSIARGVNPVKG